MKQVTVSKIVVKPDPDMVYKAVLDGQSYDIRIRYNQRLTNVSSGNPISADAFEIWIGLSGKAPILQTPLKTNRNLLLPYKYRPDCPQGILVLRDFTADSSRADGEYYDPERVSYTTLGDRFQIMYISPQ